VILEVLASEVAEVVEDPEVEEDVVEAAKLPETLDPVDSLLSTSTGSALLPSSPQATNPTAKPASAPNKIKRFIPPPYFVMNYNKFSLSL
jgi:hypothetical protein